MRGAQAARGRLPYAKGMTRMNVVPHNFTDEVASRACCVSRRIREGDAARLREAFCGTHHLDGFSGALSTTRTPGQTANVETCCRREG